MPNGLIRMPKTIDDYFDEIDAARSLRVRELSELKRMFGSAGQSEDPLGVRSKALVVLSYAAWEGFYNECVDAYCDFLATRGIKVADAGWNLLVGVLEVQFESLRGTGIIHFQLNESLLLVSRIY